MSLFEEGLYVAAKSVRQAFAGWRWRATHQDQVKAGALGQKLWGEDPDERQYVAAIDILGFTALMKRNPSAAHVQLSSFGALLQRAISGSQELRAVLFSDGAYILSSNVGALANAAMEMAYRGLVDHPGLLLHGLIAFDDFRLGLPLPEAAQERVVRVHWAGQGVLTVGLKEKLLPKGAMIFLDPSVPDEAYRSLPTANVRLLWSERRSLDWTQDVNRRKQIDVIWRKLHHDPPQYLSHIVATKRWLRARASSHGIALEAPRFAKPRA